LSEDVITTVSDLTMILLSYHGDTCLQCGKDLKKNDIALCSKECSQLYRENNKEK